MASTGPSAARAFEDDLANVEFETSEDVDVIPTFDSMALREDLLRGVYAYGMNHDRTCLTGPLNWWGCDRDFSNVIFRVTHRQEC
jgi:hypothetical protein